MISGRMLDRHLFRSGGVFEAVVGTSIRVHQGACMRVVEMSVQAQANAVTGRGGCCHNKRHTLERKPRKGGVKPNLFIYAKQAWAWVLF